MSDYRISLDSLYARSDAIGDAIGTGRTTGDGWGALVAMLDRLAANRRLAGARGWTSCAIERRGGGGWLRLWGVPPSGRDRELVPDWAP